MNVFVSYSLINQGKKGKLKFLAQRYLLEQSIFYRPKKSPYMHGKDARSEFWVLEQSNQMFT